MKKIGLLALAMVLAVGGMGVGYAAWIDTIYINGTVDTGAVCLEFEGLPYYGEINLCPDSINNPGEPADQYWSGWEYKYGILSCPNNHRFVEKGCTNKDVASITFVEVLNDTGQIVGLEVTVNNAYPHFLGHFTVEVCNCGTIPIKLRKPAFDQSPFLLIEYRNGDYPVQLEPDECKEMSFFVGVVQHKGYWDNSHWIVDDPREPLLPMDTDLTFTIDIEGIQWNEYTP
jgi:hypothetical protein